LVIAARLSHPSWFRPSWLFCTEYSPTQQLILLAVVAVCAGNVWYVFHRFSVHQLMERAIYGVWVKWGSGKKEPPDRPYREWLIQHISKRFWFKGDKPVELRSAQIIFMVIVCEIALISALCHERCSWIGHIGRYKWLIVVLAAVFFCCAIWQYYILFDVDNILITKRLASEGSDKPS
jgi:hypothetical protein